MSWSPNVPTRPHTVGSWHPTKVFNPHGGEETPARGGAGRTTRTTRSRATRGRAVPQRNAR